MGVRHKREGSCGARLELPVILDRLVMICEVGSLLHDGQGGEPLRWSGASPKQDNLAESTGY